MPVLLFLTLASVYALGVAGVAFAGSIVEPEPYEPAALDERLAVVRDDTSELASAPTPPREPRPRS